MTSDQSRTIKIESSLPLTIKQQLMHDYYCAMLKGGQSPTMKGAVKYAAMLLEQIK